MEEHRTTDMLILEAIEMLKAAKATPFFSTMCAALAQARELIDLAESRATQ